MSPSSSLQTPGMTTAARGRLLVACAAVLWSASGFFAKAPLFESWPVADRAILLAFWRAVFASVLLVPMVRKPRWTPGLIPMALLFVIMNYTYLSAMTRTSAANAIWLQNTAPVWVFLVGVVFLGEPVQRGDWCLVLLGAVGVGFILVFETRGAQQAGVVFGLLAGITYAGVVLSIRLLRHEDAAWLIAVNHLATALVLSPYVVWKGTWPDGEQLVYLCGFGMLQMGLPYVLFARGLRAVTGHEAAGIALLEPVLVPVWVFLAWHGAPSYQPPQWWTFVGGGLILAGLLLRLLASRSRGATAANRPDTG
ncbi:MAG: hypothetical protein FJ276_07170, partial [Planctomycetes bacterium]|nr:hypothetical protein [Planctomycetota bacterium]